MGDKTKLEVIDTIDRRKNKRYYPTNMEVKISGDREIEKLIVDDISVEGVRLFLKNRSPFCEGEMVQITLPGLNEKISGEVFKIDDESMRIKFPKEERVQQLLETNFQNTKLFA